VADHNFGSYPVPLMYYTDIKEYEQHAGQLIPAESAIPSQSGTTLQSEWFWKEDYTSQDLRPAKQIVEEWLRPFNERHCNLILNVAPNRDGRFDDNAIARLSEIGKLWKDPGPAPRVSKSIQITTPNLAFGQPSFASSIQDASGADLANDHNFRTAWTADTGQTRGWIEIKFKQPTSFNTVAIVASRKRGSEDVPSIRSYQVQHWHNGAWQEIAKSSSAAIAQLCQFPAIETSRVRIDVEGVGGEAPSITEFGIYKELIE